MSSLLNATHEDMKTRWKARKYVSLVWERSHSLAFAKPTRLGTVIMKYYLCWFKQERVASCFESDWAIRILSQVVKSSTDKRQFCSSVSNRFLEKFTRIFDAKRRNDVQFLGLKTMTSSIHRCVNSVRESCWECSKKQWQLKWLNSTKEFLWGCCARNTNGLHVSLTRNWRRIQIHIAEVDELARVPTASLEGRRGKPVSSNGGQPWGILILKDGTPSFAFYDVKDVQLPIHKLKRPETTPLEQNQTTHRRAVHGNASWSNCQNYPLQNLMEIPIIRGNFGVLLWPKWHSEVQKLNYLKRCLKEAALRYMQDGKYHQKIIATSRISWLKNLGTLQLSGAHFTQNWRASSAWIRTSRWPWRIRNAAA